MEILYNPSQSPIFFKYLSGLNVQLNWAGMAKAEQNIELIINELTTEFHQCT